MIGGMLWWEIWENSPLHCRQLLASGHVDLWTFQLVYLFICSFVDWWSCGVVDLWSCGLVYLIISYFPRVEEC